jgi:signal transduction histidine kinase/CHASE1-domain containing sensor protein
MIVHKQLFSPSKPAWWAGLLLSLGVGAVLYVAAAKSVDHDAYGRFINQSRNAQYSIASRIKAYTDVLRASASFFDASEQVSPDSFRRYVAGLGLAEHFPALDNINYVRYVREDQRAAYEQAMRPRGSQAPFIYPPGPRADYMPITLIEPLAPFRDKLGYDIASKPEVTAVLNRSRDTGTLSASGHPIQSRLQPTATWLAMRLPIYRSGLPLENVAQRRAAFLGSVGIGFSVHRLVRSALQEMPDHKVRLALYDGGEAADISLDHETMPAPATDLLLFDSMHGPGGVPGPGSDSYCIMLPLDFNGRLWKAMFCAPKSEWISGFDAFLPWLAMLTGFLGSMLIFLLFHTLSSSRLRAIQMAKAMTKELRDSQSKLQLSHHKLRRLAAHADQIKEQERKRIAREIHDDLGQNLLVLRIDADMLATRTRYRHPRLHARARATLAQIDSTIKSVRTLINDLRPTVLDLGLNAAVEWQIAQFRARSGIVCELIEHQNDISISDHCATAFFRVLQESLSNILQHARASLVRVELRQQGNMLTMTISDNGVGIRDNSRNKLGSFGLVGIEERVSILGGQCTISGCPNAGTTVTISVPVDYQPVPPYPSRTAASAEAL